MTHRDGFPRFSGRTAWRGDAGHRKPCGTPALNFRVAGFARIRIVRDSLKSCDSSYGNNPNFYPRQTSSLQLRTPDTDHTSGQALATDSEEAARLRVPLTAHVVDSQ